MGVLISGDCIELPRNFRPPPDNTNFFVSRNLPISLPNMSVEQSRARPFTPNSRAGDTHKWCMRG